MVHFTLSCAQSQLTLLEISTWLEKFSIKQ
jgi:hypothetical protein